MKWLLLLLIVSCGKHTEPAPLDMRDTDGDHILNFEEKGDEKFIANIEPMEKVTGTMKVNLGVPTVIAFTNQIDYTTKFLVGREGKNVQEDYFSEWSKLVLSKTSKSDLKESQYSITLQFGTMKKSPRQVSLISGEKSWIIGSWSPIMTINLSRENLNALLEGSAHLNLDQEIPKENIRKKTYRVYVFDGNQSKVYYVSKDWTVKEVMNFFNIKDYQQILEDNLFQLNSSSESEWFVREFTNGDMILSFTSGEAVKTNFLKRFKNTNFQLERKNGLPNKPFRLPTSKNAQVLFKIRPTKTLKKFLDYQYEKDFGQYIPRLGKLGKNKCHFTARNSIKEEEITPAINDFLDSVTIKTDVSTLRTGDYLIQEDTDDIGQYFYLVIQAPGDELVLNINRLLPETYVQTGELTAQCSEVERKPVTDYENPEGKLSFDIESYVENNP